MFTLIRPSNVTSSREQIRLKGVKNDILILPGDNYRLVLEVSSVNFELKSEAEQDLIIDNYQSFLNALPCSLQILFRTRSMDLDGYLSRFQGKNEKSTKARTAQIQNYCHFVKNLVSDNRILSRSFYIVLPINTNSSDEIETICQQFNLLEDILKKGLERLGMRTRRLSGLEILDLFYSFYNPEKSKTQSITNQVLNLINGAYL
ncbi:MAG TPA: hypothetical protein VFN31_03830 [Candidatus Saccharimonadales bacterium]|nr:hypothetical protein [Candidatus Saccharimonadales bacterium]